jgi:hypothetical protein
LDAPGVLHHVMARGIERRPIFIDDRDRDEFVRRLSDLALEGKLIVYAWSLMPNTFIFWSGPERSLCPGACAHC